MSTQPLDILPKEVVGETGVEPAASWSRRKVMDLGKMSETILFSRHCVNF